MDEDEEAIADIFMESDDEDTMVDYLVLAGADLTEARDRVQSMMGGSPPHVWRCMAGAPLCLRRTTPDGGWT